MTTWQKKAFWIAGITALVALGLGIAVALAFDAARIKNLVRDMAQKTWSRELSIGDLSLRLLPFPVLQAENLSLANPSWAKSQHFLQASKVTAHLELLPLLGRKIRVKRLTLDGLEANLEVAPDGMKNWDLTSSGKSPNASTDETTGADLLPLKSIRIRNAVINFPARGTDPAAWHIDEISGKASAGLRNVHIYARLVRNKQPMQVQATFDDLSSLGSKGAISEGAIDLRWDSSHLKIVGTIPLEASLQGQDLQANFTSASFSDVLGFLGVESGKTAPAKASALLTESRGKVETSDLKITLGKLLVSGSAQLALSGQKPTLNAQLAADRMDWTQMLLDAGRPPRPPKPPEELLHTHPLPWHGLVALRAIDGTIDAQITTLKLRSGIQLNNAKARVNLKGDQLNMTAFSASLLQGSVSGSMQLDPRKKSASLKFTGENLSLAEWFSERGKKVAFTGGPMKINASVSASGSSMKELAASLSGPVSIDMGPGVISSQKAGGVESLLTGMFAGSDADQINLECAAAQLPFSAGRAAAEPIVGARSDSSQLLTAGYIDLREQTLDLRGKVKASSGVSLGVSTMAGDVRIAGKLIKPEFGMDPAGTPEALARLGAAIVTGGISLLGTAIWDAANTKGDPCAIASFTGQRSKPAKPAKPAR